MKILNGIITTMVGYAKAGSVSAITTADTLLGAIGKLEKALDDKLPLGANAVSATKISQLSMPADLHNWIPYGSTGTFSGEGSNITNAPDTSWWRYIGTSHVNSAGYISLIAMSLFGNDMRIKYCQNGTWSAWTKVATGIHIQSTTPSSPQTNDLWIW